MIPIQPQHCLNILSGIKKNEVRKSLIKELPAKVLIYCTKRGERLYLTSDKKINHTNCVLNTVTWELEQNIILNGKVIAEFILKDIESIEIKNDFISHEMHSFGIRSCLSPEELRKYANGKTLFGWGITELKVYDIPKELAEFKTTDINAVKNCLYRERIYNNPDYTNGAFLKGSYICNKEEYDMTWCDKCKLKPITAPPQNWLHVEGL